MTFLIDCWRSGGALSLWLRSPDGDRRVTIPYRVWVYADDTSAMRAALKRRGIPIRIVTRRTWRGPLRVLRIPVPRLDEYEAFIKGLERDTRHRVPFYDADVPPEQRFLHERGLYPGCRVDASLSLIPSDDLPSLLACDLMVECLGDPRRGDCRVVAIRLDDQEWSGEEREVLASFAAAFCLRDPDVIRVAGAFRYVPLLDARLRAHGFASPLHRFDDAPLRYRGGKSFHSYGQVRFRDFAVRLRGRLLVDTESRVGGSCDPEAILELCRISGAPFQQVGSRSHGAVFQVALVRRMLQQGMIIPFKQKPLPEPVSMAALVKQDRAGLVLDARVGFHRDVAEIDFASMFPQLMADRNISAEVLNHCGRGCRAPGVDLWLDDAREGLIAQTMLPFLDLRNRYKEHPSEMNRRRAEGVKGVLVSANGYLRFREFKLGLPTTHAALCAHVRECFLTAVHLAEERGFTVLHGIVDSLYLSKPGLEVSEVQRLCQEIAAATGVPMKFEGLFKWMVFLPSVRDAERPVVTRYYGALAAGGIKVRGVEARQKGVPLFVRRLQEAVILRLSEEDSVEGVRSAVGDAVRLARESLRGLPLLSPEEASHRLVISKTSYSRDIPQRRIVSALRRRGRSVVAGMRIAYVVERGRGPVLLEECLGVLDLDHYRLLVARALFSVLQPFGFSRDGLLLLLAPERQESLRSFLDDLRVDPSVDGLVEARVLSDDERVVHAVDDRRRD